MKFLEEDLEEIIYQAHQQKENPLLKRGLRTEGLMKRQLRIGNYGIADLVTFHREYDSWYDIDRVIDGERLFFEMTNSELHVTIYELKKDKIGISAYLQAVRYAKGIEHYLETRGFKFDVVFEIVLIGKTVDNSGAFCYLSDINQNLKFVTYKYDFDGVKFTTISGYKLPKPKF